MANFEMQPHAGGGYIGFCLSEHVGHTAWMHHTPWGEWSDFFIRVRQASVRPCDTTLPQRGVSSLLNKTGPLSARNMLKCWTRWSTCLGAKKKKKKKDKVLYLIEHFYECVYSVSLKFSLLVTSSFSNNKAWPVAAQGFSQTSQVTLEHHFTVCSFI